MEKSLSLFVSWQGATELCATSKAITRITKARNTFKAIFSTILYTLRKISVEAYCQLSDQTLAVQRSISQYNST